MFFSLVVLHLMMRDVTISSLDAPADYGAKNLAPMGPHAIACSQDFLLEAIDLLRKDNGDVSQRMVESVSDSRKGAQA